MSYAGMGVEVFYEGVRAAPNVSPLAPPACPPGYYLGTGSPRPCVQSPTSLVPPTAQVRAVPNQSAPVSDWRRQVERMLETAARLVTTLPSEIVAQVYAFIAGLAPTTQREGTEFSRALLDPNKSDADVAAKLKTVSDQYRSLRSNLPAPAVGIFDPIVDGAWNLVPTNLRPAGNLSTACSSDVPWAWIAGGFLGGLATAAIFGGSKPTPNRRVRRNRRRR